MDILHNWFQANLDVVFFIYGLSFVLMGISILFQYRKDSRFKIAAHMWILAAFGFTHGLNEWLDMWAIIKGNNETLDRIRWLCLTASFFFIFEFGRRLFSLRNSHASVTNSTSSNFLNRAYLLSLTIGMLVIIMGLSAQDFWKTESILIRYFFGFPGSIMAGLGFIYFYKSRKEELSSIKVKHYFYLAGGSFISYGLLGGLIVPRGEFFPANTINNDAFISSFHIPVQSLRTCVAVITAWAISGMLKIFTWETNRTLQKLLSEWTHTFDSISDYVSVHDREYRFVKVNRALCNFLKKNPEELIGKNCYELFHNTKEPWPTCPHRDTLKTSRTVEREIEDPHIGCPMSITTSPIFNDKGEVVASVHIARDISEIKKAELDLLKAATTDRLTGLMNRFSFETDEVKMEKPVLLLINIDGFKHINAFYGTQAGDHVLINFSRFLNRVIPDDVDARVYRLGADDFGIMYEETSGCPPEMLAKTVIDMADREKFIYRDYDLSISISVGISRERPLIGKADIVLKHIKRNMRLKCLEYSDDLKLFNNISENLNMLNALKQAIKNDNIIVYSQPIINNLTRSVDKHECLVRMINNEGVMLSPDKFLNVAKEAKLYSEITAVMIRKSFLAFRNSSHEFSINISIEDILDDNIREFILITLSSYPEVSPRATFEILESEGIENYQAVHEFVKDIKKHDCKISIDDFGAGFSNFNHVLKLDVDYIKIDSSLIRDIESNINSQIIVKTIVDFSKKLGIKSIAEHVSSKGIFEKVADLGADYSQGYYIGKPEPVADSKPIYSIR